MIKGYLMSKYKVFLWSYKIQKISCWKAYKIDSNYTFSDFTNPISSSGLLLMLDGGWLRSFPPGWEEAWPYQIIPATAKIIPMITCRLSPSLPNKTNPNVNTRTVFMWPSTWNDTAVNLPMQMNWLRFVPIAMAHESAINICKRFMVKRNKFRCLLTR